LLSLLHLAYGLDWTCKYDDPKKYRGWHCDLKISDNGENLAKNVVKDLQVEFVLSKTYSDMNANKNSKIKTNLLRRKLFRKKNKRRIPSLTFLHFISFCFFISLYLFCFLILYW
jgi:hypothetical protein